MTCPTVRNTRLKTRCAATEHCPSLLVKRSSCHSQVLVMSAINPIIIKNPTPGHYLIQRIKLDVPHLKSHEQLANQIIHKRTLALLSAQQFQQPQRYELAGCYLAAPAASKPRLFLRSFFFSMTASVLPPARWVRKKSRRERITRDSMFIFSRSVSWGGEP